MMTKAEKSKEEPKDKKEKINIRQIIEKEKDDKFRPFLVKTLNTTEKVYGIRTPKLKEIAKTISKENFEYFLNNVSNESFEETMIEGFVIGYINESMDKKIKRVDSYVPKIKNWAVCDMFIANLHIAKKAKEKVHNQELFWKLVQKYIKSSKEFELRFALVLMLDYFIDDNYIEKVLKTALKIKKTCKYYYTNMGLAWLISICYIKYPKETLPYLNQSFFSDFVINKSISKICDSYRVSEKEKENVRKLRVSSKEKK